jgi:hypothetical protein
MPRFLVSVFLMTAACLSAQTSESRTATFEDSGNGFLATCADKDTSTSMRAMCVAYVNGVSDGYQLAQGSSRKDFCLPEGSTHGQIFDLVVKFTTDHPDIRHWQTRELTGRALIETFPCKKPPANVHGKG